MPPATRNPASRSSTWMLVLAIAGVAVLAGVALWPALQGGYLSDDLQINYFLNPRAAAPELDLRAVTADFARPWLGTEGGATYRPIISLHYGLDLALAFGDDDPRFALHFSNWLLHVLSSALVAGLAALLWHRTPVRAALLAGALFAVHPASIETAAWIAGRVSGTQVFFSLLACVAFALHLRTARGTWWCAAAMAAALALGSKESAIALPVAFLALEWIDDHPAPLRLRLARHLGLIPLWTLYFTLRMMVLGSLVGEGLEHADAVDLTAAPSMAMQKVQAIWAPWPHQFLTEHTSLAPWLPWFALLWVPIIWIAALDRRGRRTLLATAMWTAALCAPAWNFHVGLREGGMRLIYEAVVPCALLAAMAISVARYSWQRVTATLAALVIGTGFALSMREQMSAYEQGWRAVDQLGAELTQRAETITETMPLALVVPSRRDGGVPIWNSNALFPLAQQPFASADLPFLGLGCTFESVLHSETFFGDAVPLRVVGESGVPLLFLAGDKLIEHRRDPAQEAALPMEIPLGANALRVLFAERLPTDQLLPRWIEGLSVVVEGAPQSGQVRWISPIDTAVVEKLRTQLPAGQDPLSMSFGRGASEAGRTRFEIDLSASLFFFGHDLIAGGIRGFELKFEPALEPSAVLEWQMFRRMPELQRPTALQGTRILLGSEDLVLRVPAEVREPAALDLVLLGPHAALRVPVSADGRVRFSELVARDLRRIASLSRLMRFWFYFEERPRDDRARFSRRSRLDWFDLEVPK